MKLEQFEHTIRAAGAILGVDEVLVIGSQAIHASINIELPEAERSIEVDIAVLEDIDGSKADLIDGSIGELSVFQETFGYYAQGVTFDTAILPSGWRERLVPYQSPYTNGVTALCLEPHDLWISKAIANRIKDREFCTALLNRSIVKAATLHERLEKDEMIEQHMKRRTLELIQKDTE
ncbi:MAG: DUF6036 family nucleotidyltransferase [Pseudomonadota bacterium]